jgi:phytoene dehydrogenase-like protein
MPDDTFDVIVVGGGPNGLTCAAYLARAGARVVVLDKRFEWGGTMMTDDYSTPFSYNPAQYALPLGRELPPYADLELERIAVRLVEPDPVAAFVPVGGGEPLVVGRDLAALGALAALLDAADHAVTPLLYVPPMPVEEVERALDRDETRGALELARMTPAQAAALPGDERAAALVRYLSAKAGFDAADEPLGLLRISSNLPTSGCGEKNASSFISTIRSRTRFWIPRTVSPSASECRAKLRAVCSGS